MNNVIKLLERTSSLMEGHFLLSSGKHSNRYVQCAKVLSYPEYAEMVISEVVRKISDLDIDLIVGPAMGGVIVAYEMGRQLEIPAIFTERKDGEMTLRRGFEIRNGARVMIAEDVVTTGKSTMETKKVIEELGGDVIGVASIIDRTGGKSELDIPLYGAVKIDIDTFEKENCPLCKDGSTPVKPGSRN